jgi:hypothetical protein
MTKGSWSGRSTVRPKKGNRFHLEQAARVKGSFSAHGNVSVYITGDYYSSHGAISADSIDVRLRAGTYELVVTARETVGFSVQLFAYYDQ